jgi:FkbM family methyltransferase
MSFFSRGIGVVRTTPWLGRWALRALPDMRWKINVHPIGRLEIRLRRDRNSWLRSPILSDGFMLGALQRLIHPGDVVYDIGANIGIYSRFMAQQFGAGRVYAFEPVAGNYPRLVRNLEIGGCADRAEALQLAIGDEDGLVDFQSDDMSALTGALDAVNHGTASRNRVQYHLPPQVEKVRVARLDTVIPDRGLATPDVVKLDIEGAEAMALRGAPRLLEERKPRWVIELHSGPVAAEVLEILWKYRYRCFGYLHSGTARVYREITAADLTVIRDEYALRYVAASLDGEELKIPIRDPEWIPKSAGGPGPQPADSSGLVNLG